MTMRVVFSARHLRDQKKNCEKGAGNGQEQKISEYRIYLGIVCAVSLGGGCATKGQTGALAGAGAGAMIGGLANMHGSWGATALVGAGIGAGVGYLIGNEQDKKDATKRQAASKEELNLWQALSGRW